MTNENFYNMLQELAEAHYGSLNSLSVKVSRKTGRAMNLSTTKGKGILPPLYFLRELRGLMSDDKLHEACLLKLKEERINNDEEISDFMAELELTDSYKYKLRLRRKMQRREMGVLC